MLNNKRLLEVLELLENSISPEIEDGLHASWLEFTEDRNGGEVFIPRRAAKCEISPQPAPGVNDTLGDDADGYVNMMISQYTGCLRALQAGNGALMTIRSNYGIGILPSLFGCELFIMPAHTNSLPNVKSLNLEAVRELLDKGVPDIRSGLGNRTLCAGGMFAEIAARYPKIGKYVHVIHPDLQGPMDVAEVVCGTDIFYALYDDPDCIRAFLQLICDTYKKFIDHWHGVFPPGEVSYHWGLMHKGTIMLRDDSAMNLSSEMFDEWILPYDSQLLKHCGGGVVHFCGKGDHYIKSCSGMEGLYAIAMSQPEYNDMDLIYKYTICKNIKLLALSRDAALSCTLKEKSRISIF